MPILCQIQTYIAYTEATFEVLLTYTSGLNCTCRFYVYSLVLVCLVFSQYYCMTHNYCLIFPPFFFFLPFFIYFFLSFFFVHSFFSLSLPPFLLLSFLPMLSYFSDEETEAQGGICPSPMLLESGREDSNLGGWAHCIGSTGVYTGGAFTK